MKYKLRQEFTTDANIALQEILTQRGVQDVDNFMHPTAACELNPYDLDNIKDAARMLLKHLKNDSKILLIVD